MAINPRLAFTLVATMGLCIASFGAAAFSRSGMPVRCETTVGSADVNKNVIIDCETADGVAFTDVPAGKYLFVTDIKITRRLTGQTQFLADVRAWSSSGFFINNVSFNVDYSMAPDGATEHFQTPFIIVPPGGHLATYHYNSPGSGHQVQLSGILTDSLVGDPDMFKDGFESVARGFVDAVERTYG